MFAFSLGLGSFCRHLVPQFGLFSQTHLLGLQPPAVLRAKNEPTVKKNYK